MLLFWANSNGVGIIKTRYNRLEKTLAFYIITQIIDALIKKSTIAMAIFFQVLLKAYFYEENRQISSCINNLVTIRVYILGKSSYKKILFKLIVLYFPYL